MGFAQIHSPQVFSHHYLVVHLEILFIYASFLFFLGTYILLLLLLQVYEYKINKNSLIHQKRKALPEFT